MKRNYDPGDERLARLADRWAVGRQAIVRARFEPPTIIEILEDIPAP